LKLLPESYGSDQDGGRGRFPAKAAAEQKIKRKGEMTLELEPTADILAEVARRKTSGRSSSDLPPRRRTSSKMRAKS
jgi:hypothetical protein